MLIHMSYCILPSLHITLHSSSCICSTIICIYIVYLYLILSTHISTTDLQLIYLFGQYLNECLPIPFDANTGSGFRLQWIGKMISAIALSFERPPCHRHRSPVYHHRLERRRSRLYEILSSMNARIFTDHVHLTLTADISPSSGLEVFLLGRRDKREHRILINRSSVREV